MKSKIILFISILVALNSTSNGQKLTNKIPADSIVILSPLIQIVKMSENMRRNFSNKGTTSVKTSDGKVITKMEDGNTFFSFVNNVPFEKRAYKTVLSVLQRTLDKNTFVKIPILPTDATIEAEEVALKSIRGGHFNPEDRRLNLFLNNKARYSLFLMANNTYGEYNTSTLAFYIIDNKLKKFIYEKFIFDLANLGNSKNVNNALYPILDECISGLKANPSLKIKK